MLSPSPISRFMSSGEVLQKLWPALRSRKGSGSSPWPSRRAFSSSTAALVGSSTQSSRRSTVNGRITLP